ncbi:MAG: class I SAM-dependent methyltransferase [Bacteroidetes bacterium]|nr:class I SAM-dependent methyltransferase [Bacteroidota bacterium]
MDFIDLYKLPGIPGRPTGLIKLFNQITRRMGFNFELTPIPDGKLNMHTIEQRMNFSLLAICNLAYHVPGEWAEFGCYNGQSAMVFQKMLDVYRPGEKISLFDSFTAKYELHLDIKQNLLDNFKQNGLGLPQLIEGNFYDTVPSQLAAQYSLVHIDCGVGGDKELHERLIIHLLSNIYPRLSKGAIVLFMDYHDPEKTVRGQPINTGVKSACDIFFKDKVEKVMTLYGNHYSHGFIIKL